MKYTEVTDELVSKVIPPRKSTSHKGENGRVLVVGGSFLYHGAPLLASLAALRSGVDLVYLAVPRHLVASIRAYVPDLIVIPLPDMKITKGVCNKIVKLVESGKIQVDSILLGPGLIGIRKEIGILAYKLSNLNLKIVLDAGALYPEIVKYVKNTMAIITPHGGEFYRIFNVKVEDDIESRVENVYKMAKDQGVVILLKGKVDVISDGNEVYINKTGNAGMTVGGTGDVLAGLVTGLLAKGMRPIEAAFSAAYINGKCGENAFVKYGLHFTASDVINEIPHVMKKYDKIVD